MGVDKIDPEFSQHSDVLSRKLQEDLTIAKRKTHVRSIEVRVEDLGVYIETVGVFIPSPLRQDVNLNHLAVTECERTHEDGECLVFARLEVLDAPNTSCNHDVDDDWRR